MNLSRSECANRTLIFLQRFVYGSSWVAWDWVRCFTQIQKKTHQMCEGKKSFHGEISNHRLHTFFFFKTKFLLILLHFSLGLSISSGSALSFILLLLYFVSSYSLPLTRLSRASILSHSFAQNLMYKLYFTLLLQYRPTEEWSYRTFLSFACI